MKNSSKDNLFYQENNGAIFSDGDNRQHRYALWRIWDKSKPLVMIIGLNPSKANETEMDNTIHKVKNFAQHWGYGGFYMMNLFSYVSTDAKKLIACTDNTLNDSYLHSIRKSCRDVIFAWGKFDQAKERCKKIIEMFPDAYCFKLNKDGSPMHPLFIAKTTKIIPYVKSANSK